MKLEIQYRDCLSRAITAFHKQEWKTSEILFGKAKRLSDKMRLSLPDKIQLLQYLVQISQKMDDFTEAENYFEELIQQEKELYGAVHIEVANTYSNFAYFYESFGELDLAEHFFMRCLQQEWELFGKQSPEIIDTLNNLAFNAFERNQLEQAENYFLEVFQIQTENEGVSAESLIKTLKELAKVLLLQSKWKQTEVVYLHLISISKEKPHLFSLGDLFTFYFSLGNVYNALGLFHETYRYYEACHQIIEEKQVILPDVDVIDFYNNFAVFSREQKNYSDAHFYYSHALQKVLESVGLSSVELGDILFNYAVLYCEIQEWEPGEQSCKQSLQIRQQHFPKYHKDVMANWKLLSKIYFAQGKHDLAQKVLRDLIDIGYSRIAKSA